MRSFWESKTYPKIVASILIFGILLKEFDTIDLGSFGQRALKLLAVKVGGLKKKSATLAIPAKLCASAIGLDSSGVE